METLLGEDLRIKISWRHQRNGNEERVKRKSCMPWVGLACRDWNMVKHKKFASLKTSLSSGGFVIVATSEITVSQNREQQKSTSFRVIYSVLYGNGNSWEQWDVDDADDDGNFYSACLALWIKPCLFHCTYTYNYIFFASSSSSAFRLSFSEINKWDIIIIAETQNKCWALNSVNNGDSDVFRTRKQLQCVCPISSLSRCGFFLLFYSSYHASQICIV